MELTETANPTTKWLRYLFYAHIAGIVAALIQGEGISLLALAVTAAEVFCLYKLIPLGERYQKAALFMGIGLVLTLLSLVAEGALLLTLAISVLSLIATWQEYNAHSQLVAEFDEKLSGNWRKLFYWQLVAGILAAVMTTVATVALVMAGLESAAIVAIITMVMTGILAVLGIVYLVYLNRTAKYFGA